MPDQAQRTVLLVRDVQRGSRDRLQIPAGYLARGTDAVRAVRGHGVPVIHVVGGFRPGMPEISGWNQSFANVRQQNSPHVIDPRPATAPEAGELVVTTRRMSAFTGSDLEVLLRADEVDHL